MHPPVWTSLAITTLCISIFALSTSLVSLWFGWRNHLRAEAQDRRRQPKLAIELQQSHIRRSRSDGRLYCFQIQVRNPTDTDNAISSIELRVVFKMADGTELIGRIGQVEGKEFPCELREPLAVPVRIGAHNLVSGWCAFDLSGELIGDKTIEGYQLEVQDTHSLVSSLAPRIVQFPLGEPN